MPYTCTEAAKAAGLYKETGRIEEQILKTWTASGELAEHRMAEIDYHDLVVATDQLDIMLRLENPIVQTLFARNTVLILSTIRCVNVDSASGFKGSVGAGRQLDMLMLRPQEFWNCDTSGSYRTTWQRNIPAASSYYFVQGSTDASNLTMGDNEAMIILGFIDPAEQPVVNALQITYLSQNYNIQNLDFGIVDYQGAYPVMELMQPVIVFPKESAKINCWYYAAGTDWLQPVGLWIKMSENLRNLMTS